MKFLLVLLLFALPASAAAQVGYEPEESPFRDLMYRHELTAYSGWLNTGADPAGVAAQSGPLVGLRYDVYIGGPAYFTARLAYAPTERTVVDPDFPAETRVLGTASAPLLLSDLGVAVALTGRKSVYGLVPLVHAGLGIASDLEREADVGGYRFGTNFALSFGGGIQWTAAERWRLRADISDHLYKIEYPESYYIPPPGGGDPVLSSPGDGWTHNVAFTLGLSYLFFR